MYYLEQNIQIWDNESYPQDNKDSRRRRKKQPGRNLLRKVKDNINIEQKCSESTNNRKANINNKKEMVV